MRRATTHVLPLVIAAALPLLMGVDLLQSRNRAVEDGNARMQAGKA